MSLDRPSLPSVRRFLIGLLPTLLVFAVWPYLPTWLAQTPAAAYYLTTLFAISYGGFVSGVTSILAVVAFHVLVIRPHLLQAPLEDVPGLIRTSMFAVTSLAFAVVVSTLQESRRRLRRAVDARDEFLSLASHELKTPVAVLKLQNDLVRLTLSQIESGAQVPGTEINELVSGSDRQIRHISALIEDLLDISKIDRGGLTCAPEYLEFSSVVKQVVGGFAVYGSVTHELGGSEILSEIEDGIYARWDKKRIEQLLSNLIINAIKFGKGQPIRVAFLRAQNGALLSVTDCGSGIKKEDQERIFEKFERAPYKTAVGGLGLGLYISKQIAEMHSGRIWVQSEIDRGSSFFVCLPLDPANGS